MTLAGADGFGWMIAATLLRPAGSRRGAGAPVWRLSRFSPLFETDLCGLTGLLGRRGCRPQSHAIGLRPHMSPPDANEGSNRNDNKRQGYRIPHSKFSLCDLGSLGPGRNGEDQKWLGLYPYSPSHTTCTIGVEGPFRYSTYAFSANVRGTSMTLLCYPKRAEVPGLPTHTVRCERIEEERFSC